MARALLDTGAVVALVNRDDRNHDAAAEWFRGFRGTLLTTEAVVTETAYVLGASPAHQRAALLWFERARASGLLKVEPVADYAALARIMAQYADLPCEYADASLIALGGAGLGGRDRDHRSTGFLGLSSSRSQALSNSSGQGLRHPVGLALPAAASHPAQRCTPCPGRSLAAGRCSRPE